MKVSIILEAGYREALLGLGLSYGHSEDMERMERVARTLSHTEGSGHDKFLRAIMVVLDITAPRYWWQEFDTYKVGTVTQSESTMHSLHKQPLTEDMFEGYCGDLRLLNDWREEYRETRDEEIWRCLIQALPQSYVQRRIVSTNYGVLKNIISQRKGHKLREWKIFIDGLNVEHPELL